MKRYIETSCNGMVESADGPWISCDDAWNKVRKTNERNNHFIVEAIECLNALRDLWGPGTLEDQLDDIIRVLNHEHTLGGFLRDYRIKKYEDGYDWH